jgi:hypothetical protein
MPVVLKIEGIYPPKNFLDKKMKEFEAAIKQELTGPIKTLAIFYFNRVVEKWQVAPAFIGIYSQVDGAAGALTVFPRGKGRDRWIWVSLGVHGHTITPVRALKLRVRFGYVPKTLPDGKLFGGPGVYIGDTAYLDSVEWPGIEPRHFEQFIKEAIEKRVVTRITGVARKVFKE